MNRLFRTLWIVVTACFVIGPAITGAYAADPQPAEKIKITKLDDLPQHTYPISIKISELIKSKAKMAELAKKVRADVESDLATYEINDATTLKNMYGKLLTIELIEDNEKAAVALVEKIRELEDKKAGKLTTGLMTYTMFAARRDVGPNADYAAYKKAFARQLAERAGKLPWDVVQDVIQETKGRLEIFSEGLLMGMIEAQLQPRVDQTGELSGGQASGVLGMYFTINERLPLKDEIIAVYQKLIDDNRVTKRDIWSERAVTLSSDQALTPVLAGVWDSGTDIALFKDRLFVNPNETFNGKDDDGNGYVDDVHGIAYDYHARRTTGVLKPLGEAAARMPAVMKHTKGLSDLQAAIDSPEATALKQHMSSLAPADVKGFIEDLSLAGGYAHGTHVAGIMAEGNPAIRLLIGRHSYDHHVIPVARTIEWGKRDAAKCRDTVDYFKKNGVRVVNMSWGEAQQHAEDSYEANGIGESAEERRELARKVFALQKDGLYQAINNAPDILFVCAAGNADNDVEFDEYIASSFELPNLLVVGAVDQAGEPTDFTSFGRTVQVYGNGFEVESYVPGGERIKMSGTSMASPNVANLAAKLIAMDPTLTPTKVIELIKSGSDKKEAGENSFLLLNPKKTVDMLQRIMKKG
ncbi:MAG: S8 family serine peptidase [Phycisphaerales bacterium]|nr:MAG: S8 family serine peptidase [Phycisphaerales bacterium]